jgi:hypothetical protein
VFPSSETNIMIILRLVSRGQTNVLKGFPFSGLPNLVYRHLVGLLGGGMSICLYRIK